MENGIEKPAVAEAKITEPIDQTRSTKEVIVRTAQALVSANNLLGMPSADIAVQEQYRRNAETILALLTALERRIF